MHHGKKPVAESPCPMPQYRIFHIFLLLFAFIYLTDCPVAYDLCGGCINHSFIHCSETKTKERYTNKHPETREADVFAASFLDMHAHPDPAGQPPHDLRQIPPGLSLTTTVRLIM